MTVGSHMVNGPHFCGHKEAILYRTRTEILTDQRILLDGTTYTFDQIDAVDVVRLKLVIPFQIIRALGILITGVCAWLAFTSLLDFALIPLALYTVTGAGSGATTFISSAIMPTHAIRLIVGGKYVFMMHDTSPRYLERVRAAILQGMSRSSAR